MTQMEYINKVFLKRRNEDIIYFPCVKCSTQLAVLFNIEMIFA